MAARFPAQHYTVNSCATQTLSIYIYVIYMSFDTNHEELLAV